MATKAKKKTKPTPPDYSDLLQQIASEIAAGFKGLYQVLEQNLPNPQEPKQEP